MFNSERYASAFLPRGVFPRGACLVGSFLVGLLPRGLFPRGPLSSSASCLGRPRRPCGRGLPGPCALPPCLGLRQGLEGCGWCGLGLRLAFGTPSGTVRDARFSRSRPWRGVGVWPTAGGKRFRVQSYGFSPGRSCDTMRWGAKVCDKVRYDAMGGFFMGRRGSGR